MQNKKVLKILGVAAVSAMILSGCNSPIIPQSAEPELYGPMIEEYDWEDEDVKEVNNINVEKDAESSNETVSTNSTTGKMATEVSKEIIESTKEATEKVLNEVKENAKTLSENKITETNVDIEADLYGPMIEDYEWTEEPTEGNFEYTTETIITPLYGVVVKDPEPIVVEPQPLLYGPAPREDENLIEEPIEEDFPIRCLYGVDPGRDYDFPEDGVEAPIQALYGVVVPKI